MLRVLHGQFIEHRQDHLSFFRMALPVQVNASLDDNLTKIMDEFAFRDAINVTAYSIMSAGN